MSGGKRGPVGTRQRRGDLEVAVAKLWEEANEAVAYLRAKRDGSEFSSAESGGWPERYKEVRFGAKVSEVERAERSFLEAWGWSEGREVKLLCV